MAKNKKPVNEFQKWIKTITAYERDFKKWEGRVERILVRYRDDSRKSTDGAARFNILWSNIQTIVPAVFSRLPKPDVSRRFRDNDPVGRVASLILERAIEFEIEHYPDYRAAMKNSVADRFLGGRGISWVRYEPHIITVAGDPNAIPEDGLQITEDADESDIEEQEELDYECAPVDYIHWKDFGHTIARTWEEVNAVWRKVYMGRSALIERFGEELGNKIPLDTRPEDASKRNITTSSEDNSQALIFEIWDKESSDAIWISKSLGRELDRKKDPLGLESFFPCPRPLYASLTTDSLVPVPDFTLYQDQANELDKICGKIDRLIDALQIRGVYDASVPEIQRLFTEAGNTDMIPVKNWQAFAEKNGLKGALSLVELEPIVNALNESYKAMDQVKNQVYEIMGISDIVRGSNDPRETAAAVKTKGQFGSMRLRSMQGEVVQYATELLQIKAQIMCTKFQPDTLVKISGAMQLSEQDQQLIPQALQLLKESPLRNFRIEVSSDSMVEIDEQQEKEDRMEFLQATSGFMEKALPVAQAHPEIAPLLVELLKYGVTAFKVGKSIEGVFDTTLDNLKNAQSAPQKPDPEVEKLKMQSQMQSEQLQMKSQMDIQLEQMKQQFEAQKMQQEMQMESQKAHLSAQVEQAKQQAQAQESAHQNELEAKRAHLESQNEQVLITLKMQFENEQKAREDQFNRWKVEIENQTKIAVAEISAKTAIKTSSMSLNAANIESPMEFNEIGELVQKSTLETLIDVSNVALTDNITQTY